MSRVTIDDITGDYFHDISVGNGKAALVSNIEIVPRKIVEKIIEKCDELMGKETAEKLERIEYLHVREVRNYAESLLKEFEEEK